MTILIFEIEEVKKLLAELGAAKTFNTTVEYLFNSKLYPGGVLLNGAGQTEAEALASGRDFWPSDMNIDVKKFVLSLCCPTPMASFWSRTLVSMAPLRHAAQSPMRRT